MGHFLGLGNRQVYVDNDGTYWESEHKRVQFNEKDLFPERFKDETVTVPEATVTVAETPVVSTTTEEKKDPVQEAIDKLTCSVCKYQAKSIAGLAQHKLVKRHGSFSISDVK